MTSVLHVPQATRPEPGEPMLHAIDRGRGAELALGTLRLSGTRGIPRLEALTQAAVDIVDAADFDCRLVAAHAGDVGLFALTAAADFDLRLPCPAGFAPRRLFAATSAGAVEFVPNAGSAGAGAETAHPVPVGRMAVLATGDAVIRMRRSAEIVGLVVPDEHIATGTPRLSGPLPGSALALSVPAFLHQLLVHLRRGAGESGLSAARALADLARSILAETAVSDEHEERAEMIQLAVAAIIERSHRDPATSVASIARDLHLSRRQMYRYFEHTGIAGLLAERRVATAKSLIEQFPRMSMSQIAHSAGFHDVDRMRTHFKRQLGLSPREFRGAIGQ